MIARLLSCYMEQENVISPTFERVVGKRESRYKQFASWQYQHRRLAKERK